MSIEQLRLILCDMYLMDLWYPPLFGKWSDEFKKASYSQWAVDELLDYIAEHIYPRTNGSVKEFCELTHEFMMTKCNHKQMEALGYLPDPIMAPTAESSAADLVQPILRETMTIMVNGNPTTVYKDEIEKELYKHLYSGLGLQFGG